MVVGRHTDEGPARKVRRTARSPPPGEIGGSGAEGRSGSSSAVQFTTVNNGTPILNLHTP